MNNSYIYWTATDPICDRKDQAMQGSLALNPFVVCSSSQLLKIQKAIARTKGSKKMQGKDTLIKVSDLGRCADEESACFEDVLECCPEISHRQMHISVSNDFCSPRASSVSHKEEGKKGSVQKVIRLFNDKTQPFQQTLDKRLKIVTVVFGGRCDI